jgi:hypothetical protein
MNIQYFLYLVFATGAVLFLTARTDRKGLAFILLFWIFAQPVLNAFFSIPMLGLPFELQTNRIFFLLIATYLVSAWLLKKKPTSGFAERRPEFEKYLYIYLVLVIIALLINYSKVNPKSIIATPLEVVTFIVVYIAAKRYATESILEAILKGVVILAVALALVAIVQFAFVPQLLRTGSVIDIRQAFGNYLRSTGIFQSEYDLGYFQNLALMIVLMRYRGMLRLYVLVPLLILSVLLTFHRANYIITFFCLTSYFAYFSKRKANPIALVVMLAIPFTLVFSYEVYRSIGGHSELVKERLEADTVTGRLMQYEVVANSMWDHPLGMGGYENPAYFDLMNKYGMMQWVPDGKGGTRPQPLAVHNGYLATGIQYGVLAVPVFVMLLISMFRYFRKKVSTEYRYSLVPLYAVIIYALSNMSNSITIFRAYFVILLALLSGAFVAVYRARNTAVQKSEFKAPGSTPVEARILAPARRLLKQWV